MPNTESEEVKFVPRKDHNGLKADRVTLVDGMWHSDSGWPVNPTEPKFPNESEALKAAIRKWGYG